MGGQLGVAMGYTKKNSSGPSSKYTHSGHNTQRSFDPPPKKSGTQVRGGGGLRGSKSKKNHWGIIFGPKMMILQRVRRQKPYTGVCYTKDPKKGGYTTLAPALDLTTSLRGDFHNSAITSIFLAPSLASHDTIIPTSMKSSLCMLMWGSRPCTNCENGIITNTLEFGSRFPNHP